MPRYTSWGNIPNAIQETYELAHRHLALPGVGDKKILAYGRGRSYGDVCLNDGHVILPTHHLDNYISFNTETGVICCESGVCLKDLLELIVPLGYFIPVTPGTKYVSIGGMIANDVHGKNHHRAGTFGCHVRRFELLRSDGSRLICSPTENADYYSATIGGLGLTGLITWAEIQLKAINSSSINQQTIPFADIADFISITEESDREWEYTVSWIDSLAKQDNMGKGVFFRGNHMLVEEKAQATLSKKQLQVPFNFPSWTLSPSLVKIFNRLYFSLHKKYEKRISYDKFFYPLDGISGWNKLYGKRGFYQYQCVIPDANAHDILKELLGICSKSKAGSFLSVLKKFGEIKSPGMLSFPREGYTLALDFPNRGEKTLKMLNELDAVVMHADGAVYPAKDARMSGESFQQYFPRWQQFSNYIDPAFSSSFWRRVTVE